MHIFVINLDHDQERLVRIDEQLADLALSYTRVPAIKGDAVPTAQLVARYDDSNAQRLLKRPMTRRELGCALSHLKVMETVIAQKLNHALILEDDVVLSPELPALLDSLAQVIDPTAAEFVLLSHAGKYRLRGSMSLGVGAYAIYGHHEGYNSHGYVITQAAAQQALQYFQRIYHPIDYWVVLAKSSTITVKVLVPYAVGLSSPDSRANTDDVQIAMPAVRKPWLIQIGIALHRYIYRKFIYQLLVKPFLGIKKQPLGGLEARIKRNKGLRPPSKTPQS